MRKAFLKSLAEKQPLALLVLSEEASINFANRAAEELTGFTFREILGRAITDLILPEDRFRFTKMFTALLDNPGDIISVYFCIRRRQGPPRRVRATAKNLLRDPSIRGVVVHLAETVSGTESDACLDHGEEKFRLIVEQSPIGMAIFRDDRPVYFNQGLVEITGYPPEEIASFSPGEYAKIVHPDDRSWVREQLRPEQPGGDPRPEFYTMRILHRSGKQRLVEFYSKPLNLGGKPGNLVVMNDVTEREKSLRTLKRISRLFLDLGADDEKNISLILENGRELLGIPFALYLRTENRRLTWRSLPADAFPSCFDPGEEAIFRRLLSRDNEEPLIVDELSGEPTGRGCMLESLGFRSLLGYSVAVEGKVVAAVCFLDTEPHIFESEEIEAAGMLSRVLAIEEERLFRQRSLRDFIDIISHEIRHPMTILRGYAQTLKESGHRLEEHMREEVLNSIISATDRMENLLSELVDITRIDRAQLTVVKREFALRPLLDRAVEEMSLRFPENRFSLSAPLDITVYGDPGRLLEVLVILMENAVLYSPPGSPVEVELAVDDFEVVISVLDRGMGVPPEERTRIFERFYQVEDVSHHSTPGIGLGLSIAREIVEGHGGRIWCAEREGGGSVFRFTLPVISGEQDTAHEPG